MHNINPTSLFDEHFVLENLSKLGDPLEKLNSFIDWSIFGVTINKALENKTKDSSKGGRPPFDKLLLFKSLIIQSLYNLSDEQLEFQITDRASFKRFLGLKNSDKIPDSRTFWSFRDTLDKKDLVKTLFDTFNTILESLGVFANEGQMIDASFVEAPRQRNNREENKHIKENSTPPSEWKKNPNKLAQKDTDAKWTKKNKVSHYGYKNHIKADSKTKFIKTFVVTDASVHDSQTVKDLLDRQDEGQNLYADSAYTGAKQEIIYKDKKVNPKIIEKGYKNKPLTEEQKKSNKEKSKIRVRVEHIFGFVENSMKGSLVRTIGIARAKVKVGLINLTYNLFRCFQLKISTYTG